MDQLNTEFHSFINTYLEDLQKYYDQKRWDAIGWYSNYFLEQMKTFDLNKIEAWASCAWLLDDMCECAVTMVRLTQNIDENTESKICNNIEQTKADWKSYLVTLRELKNTR